MSRKKNQTMTHFAVTEREMNIWGEYTIMKDI